MIYATLNKVTKPVEMQVASMEGAMDTVTGFFKTITNYFSEGIGFAGHTMSELFASSDSLFTLSNAEVSRLMSLSDKEIQAIKWNVPSGNKGGYKVISDAHMAAWEQLADYQSRILVPLEKWLRAVSREKKLDLRMPASLEFKFFDRAKHQKLLMAMSAGGVADEVTVSLPLMTAVPRLSDVKVINDGMTHIAKSVGGFDISEVLYLEHRISRHVEAIEVMTQTGLQDGTVRESDLKELVNVLRNAAEEQALIARTRYQLMRVETNLRAISKVV